MEIQWKHVLLFIGVVILLVHLGPIVHTLSEIITGFMETIRAAIPPPGRIDYGGGSSTYSLARLCVLLIFIVGILKVIKNSNRR